MLPEEHTFQIRESELLRETVEPWWRNDTAVEDREVITGLAPESFILANDEPAFHNACTAVWNDRSNDLKETIILFSHRRCCHFPAPGLIRTDTLLPQNIHITTYRALVDLQLRSQKIDRSRRLTTQHIQDSLLTFGDFYPDICPDILLAPTCRCAGSLNRRLIFFDHLPEVGDMLFEHEVAEDAFILPIPGRNKGFDIIGFTLLANLRWQYPDLELQPVHQQTGHAAIAVGPRMDGHQTIMGIEAQGVKFRYASSALAAFCVEPFAECLQMVRHFLESEIGAPPRLRP